MSIILKIVSIVVILVLIVAGHLVYEYTRKSGYKKSFGRVFYIQRYYDSIEGDKDELIGVDAKSFEAFPKTFYGKDKNLVYYKHHVLENSDPESFSMTPMFNIPSLFRDKNHVYYKEELISDQADSFKHISDLFFTDGKYIIRAEHMENSTRVEGFQRMEGMDAASFEVLDFPYSRDKNTIYFKDKPLVGSNPKNVKLTVNAVQMVYYANDGQSVYNFSKKLEGADAATFEQIHLWWFKDKNHVYSLGKKVEGVDVATFEMLERKDGSLDSSYGKDRKGVYYKGKKLEGVKPESFKQVDAKTWTDGNLSFNLVGKAI